VEFVLLDDLIGKPFEHGAVGPNSFDCYGLSQEVYKRLGKDISGIFGYGVTNESLAENLDKGLNKFGEKIDYPEPYCVVAFYTHPKYVTHMGIVLPNCTSFIHVLKNQFVVITSLSHPLWSKKIAGYYKYE
jgi:cell wall-associated NlpC family hydrolase